MLPKRAKKASMMTRAAFVMTSYLLLLIFAVVTPFVKTAWIAGDQSMEIGTIWRIRFGTRDVHCREKLPPTAEMVARLKYLRLIMEHNKEKGDEENYLEWKAKYEMLKNKIGDYDEDDVIGKDKF